LASFVRGTPSYASFDEKKAIIRFNDKNAQD